MSNTAQVEQNQAVTAGNPQSSSSESWTDHKFVPGAERPSDDELYGFRSAMAETVEAQDDLPRAANKTNSRVIILLVLIVSALAALLVYGVMAWLKPKPLALSNDLGTERYDPAGLGGRMIAEWTGSASYKFTIDPLDPTEIPAFQATLANPPHAITYSIKLKDATNNVVCQRDVVVPGVPEGQGAFDASTALEPRTIPTGDTLQNVAGTNGQIGEMVLTGSLTCDLDSFNKIVAWEFSTDFPPLSSQQDWKKHEDTVREDAEKAKHPVMAVPVNYGGYYPVKSLPAPIEADDVIVSDNPGKGVVATSSGRAFLVGTKVLVNPALDWQIFPAEIHYRCDRTAMCMVTRLNSRSAVRAHLMK